MDKSTIQKIKLGIFVTVGFILLTIGVYFIGEKQNMFSNNFELRTYFRNVGGLQPGNNVRFSGINVGTVEALNIENDSSIEVVMVVQEKVRPYIKKDAIASIGSDGLVGSMLVNISPGPGNLPNVEDNDIITSYSRVKAEDMITTLSSTNENIALLTSDLLKITQSIKQGEGTIATILNDSLLAYDIKASIHNLKVATNNTKKVTQELHAIALDMQDDQNVISLLTKDTTINHNMLAMMDNLQRSSENIKEVSIQLTTVLAKLEETDGALGTMLNDEEVANDLREIMKNLNQGTDMFNENMEAMRHNFLFKKYFKKQEKQKEIEIPEESISAGN